MKFLACFVALCITTLSFGVAASPRLLEPKIHLLRGFAEDPAIAYFKRNQNFDLQSLKIMDSHGKPVPQSWRFLRAFEEDLLELTFNLKPGEDHEFDTLILTFKDGSKQRAYVGPNRVLYLKPQDKYDISYEHMEQVMVERLYLGMQIFNDSNQPITIERIDYAPVGAMTGNILFDPSYDPQWFDKIALWAENPKNGLPKKTKMLDARALNVVIQPSRGFSVAVVSDSLPKKFLCGARKGSGRADSMYLQALVVYKIGSKHKIYPVPNEMFAELCF